jgi:LDH2 family malate/lactate/ureidoglycolate dehydrogenase
LAWAAPILGGDPILLDMATAAVAGGKVYAARQRGETIPPTWLIGPDGLPTTDGTLYPQQASLAPMAGHKGYGLGLFAELLSAVLPGGAITWQVGSWMFDPPSSPSLHNAGFMVVDIEAIADPLEYRNGIARLVAEISRATPAEGVDRVLLPGEREWANRNRSLIIGGVPFGPARRFSNRMSITRINGNPALSARSPIVSSRYFPRCALYHDSNAGVALPNTIAQGVCAARTTATSLA